MRIFLVHGMGRTSLSLAWLSSRLRRAGHDVIMFSYSAMREDFVPCAKRLGQFIDAQAQGEAYAVVGHSLGSVLLREALARLRHKPAAVFLLAPPTRAVAMAKFFSRWRLYKFLGGECGQLLASDGFMQNLPAPPANSMILAGTRGLRSRLLPHGDAVNDGILSVDETKLEGVPHQSFKASHTFIMNHPAIVDTICRTLAKA